MSWHIHADSDGICQIDTHTLLFRQIPWLDLWNCTTSHIPVGTIRDTLLSSGLSESSENVSLEQESRKMSVSRIHSSTCKCSSNATSLPIELRFSIGSRVVGRLALTSASNSS